jgi:Recombination endonuclease VII
MKKLQTAADKDQAKDKHIQRKFGITLADRDKRVQQQNNKCKICGGPLDAYGPPNIDHYHFFVAAFRHTGTGLPAIHFKWYAQGYDELRRVICVKHARTKEAAIADVRRELMPWSIRGLLCFKCNYGIGSMERFFDVARHPENLRPVIEYFRARLNKSLDNMHEIA